MRAATFSAIYRWCRATNRPCKYLEDFRKARAEFQQQYPFYPNLL